MSAAETLPAAASEARLYEDDGETRQYLEGAFLSRRFKQQRGAAGSSIEVSAAEGSWRPAARDLRLRILWPDAAPKRVLLGREPLPALTEARLSAEPTGWARTADGFVTVKLKDRYDSFRISLEP